MNLEIIPVGWFAIIVGILVVVASGAFLIIWKIKAAEYPAFKKYKEAQLKLPAIDASLSVEEAKLESTRNELATLSVQNEENRKEKEKHDDWERQIKESFAKLDSKQLSIKQMQDRKKKAVDDLLEKEKLLNQTNAEIEEGAKKIHEQTETLKKLEKNQKELKKVENELDAKNKKLAEVTESVGTLGEEEQGLLVRRNELIGKVTTLEEVEKKLLENIKILKKELSDLKKEIDKFEKKRGEVGNDLEETQKNLKNKTNDLKTTDKELAQKINQLGKVDEKLQDAKKVAEDLKAQKERLDNLLKIGNEDLAKREKELAEMLSNLEKAMNSAGEIASSIAESTGLKLPSLEERLIDFKRLEITTEPNPRDVSEEEESLRKCEAHFRDKGFIYSDRVLKSFHTSLKINEHSALTVLSGISGTGKSQLPRLYSEAMGMHFLSLPVQPRWDSPQDLLGFYNYVENRFKATPLSRALRQFDRFSIDDGGGNLKDEMLLVLLDEMNLARVEYYFSEFLSRLENREKALEHDNSYRRKCEIPIEAGPQQEGEGTFVYPGFNVFFVGTMNEDESTLSLSDKVLDRANVLRFGRPDKLEVAGGGNEERSLDKIPFSNWGDWVRPPLPDDADWGKKLHNLNENLDGVGKAFGHRVFKGILSYMANYPDQTDDGHKHAFADQLEVKILPKLRGLEIDNNESRKLVTHMKTLIKETDDTDLFGALEESNKRAEKRGFFSFIGVQR